MCTENCIFFLLILLSQSEPLYCALFHYLIALLQTALTVVSLSVCSISYNSYFPYGTFADFLVHFLFMPFYNSNLTV